MPVSNSFSIRETMDLNTIGIGVIGLIIAYAFYTMRSEHKKPDLPSILVPQQVGKTKHIQSKSGDASMATERTRRRAIIYGMSGQRDRIKESRVSTGSTNGSLEAFFLTAIADPRKIPEIVEKICYSIFDAGGIDSEYCYVIDGDGEEIYDAGNADTLVCNQ